VVSGILIDADDDTHRKAVRMALDTGINWIDTATSYGSAAVKTAIGWLMQELTEKERPYVPTKKAFDLTAPDFAAQAERALTDSLNRLQMDSVDLYQFAQPYWRLPQARLQTRLRQTTYS